MIIYGTGEKKLKTSQNRSYRCPECGENGISFYFFQKYFHLFWIPVFPIGRRSVAACDKCSIVYKEDRIPRELKSDFSDIKSTTKVPPYLFIGLALIITGIFLIFHFSDGMTTYKYPSGKKQAQGKMIGDEMDGKWTFWYENGNTQTVQYYKKGTEDSTWTWWNEDGSIDKMGNYRNGLSHGKWTFYYQTGKLQAEEIYVDNRRHGKATYWYENGNKNAEGEYYRDRRNNHWTFWYESGNIIEEGNFKEDYRIGDWISYYEDGQKCLHTNHSDSEYLIMDFWDKDGKHLVINGNGEFTSYYENAGKESQGMVKSGKPVGIWNYWYNDGKLKQTGRFESLVYKTINTWDNNGNRLVVNGEGYQVTKLDNGVIAEEGNYTNGLRDGLWKFRNESDMLISEINYKQGKASGKARYYNESGKIQCMGYYLNDKQQYVWTWYHQNGTKESSVKFINGKKEGEQTFWNESDKIIKKEFYSNGELINEEVY